MEFITVCFFNEFFRIQKNNETKVTDLIGKVNLVMPTLLVFHVIFIYFRTIKRLVNY